MPLTPEDVSNKRFTPVRLREGYDMGEVDAFLDEVEAELTRMHKENDDLRSKLEAATNGAVAVPAPREEEPDEPRAKEPEKAEEPEKASEPEPAVAAVASVAAMPPPSEQIRVTTAAEASSAATRLLELATRNADELVDGAREEADQILQVARTDAERLQTESQSEAERLQAESKAEAERLQAETKAEAERLDAEARNRAQQLDAETEARRREALGEIEREKTRLDGEVTNLRTFEREYRSRLKSYFTEQLATLDGSLEPEQAEGQAS